MSWPTKQIGELFDLENGFAFKSADFQDSGVPVVKIKNVKAGYFSEHDFDYVSPDFRQSRPSKLAMANDLLISMSGNRHDGSPETWVGKVAHFNKDGDYFLNQRVGALRLKPGMCENTRFFGYLMSSMPYQELFISIATSSGGQANLSPKLIFAAEVVVPSKKEQDAITSVLGALDDKIELNRRMNETLEEMARALFRDWFVDFGPTRRQMEGATDPAVIMGHALPPEKAANLAQLFPAKFGVDGLPEGWAKVSVSEFGKLKGGKQLPKTEFVEDGPFPVFGGAGHMGQTNKSNADGYVITVGRVGAYCGKFVAHRGRAWVNNNASLFHLAGSTDPEWFYLALRELDLEPIKKGAAQPFVSNGDINELPMIEPGTELRKRTNGVLEVLLRKIEANEKENKTLAALRDLLLPKLMSGEIRLKDPDAVT